jgi:protein-arginine kinase activator protein McsA
MPQISLPQFEKKCAQCGRTFYAYKENAKFCSNSHRTLFSRELRKKNGGIVKAKKTPENTETNRNEMYRQIVKRAEHNYEQSKNR